jgi:pyruvate dehydrogenase (quinone)
MSKRVANLLIETLRASGVKTCYGIVGDTLNRIAHAIAIPGPHVGRGGPES